MATRATVTAISALVVGLAIGLSAAPVRADALDYVMTAKVIKVAVPQDFAPFGSVGLDLKPQGYDIDMANLIAKALGVKVETGAGHQRQPHSLSADAQGRPRDLDPRQERRAREGDRFLRRLRAVLPGVFGAKEIAGIKSSGRPRRQDHRRDARRHRGTGADQDRAGRHDIKRFEDNNATISAFVVRPGRADRDRQHGRRHMIAKKSPARHRAQAAAQGHPLLRRHGQGRAEAAAKVNEIIAKAKASGDTRQAVGEVAEPPCRRASDRSRGGRAAMIYKLDFGESCCPTGPCCCRAWSSRWG